MKLKLPHVLGGTGLLIAAGVAWLATRSAGPVPMPRYTELREGPLMEHVITAEELITEPVLVPHHYPQRVAPRLNSCIHHGWAPAYQLPDPQAAALPAEQAW